MNSTKAREQQNTAAGIRPLHSITSQALMPDTRLYINDRLDTLGADDVEALIAGFPAWRQEHTRKIRNAIARKESAAAFALLHQALKTDFGIVDYRFAYSTQGKPHLESHPTVHFNLSHCRKAVACAISRRPVGIDIETLGRYRKSLAEYTMNEDEMREILSANDTCHDGFSERDIIFTTLWTRKEAFAKLTGEGISTHVRDMLCSCMDIAFTTQVEKGKGYVLTVAEGKTR